MTRQINNPNPTMKSVFLRGRFVHTSWEDDSGIARERQRPYTVAMAVQAGEVVQFNVRVRRWETGTASLANMKSVRSSA